MWRPIGKLVSRLLLAVTAIGIVFLTGMRRKSPLVLKAVRRTSRVTKRFVMKLPYGRNTDWLKNVLASGSATIVHEGNTYRVDRPEIVPAFMAAPLFSRQD